MKSDGVTRSVRAAKNDRLAGDAPNMGKVARMPGTGLPKGERRRRHRSDGGKNSRLRESRRTVVVIWSTLLAAGVAVVLGLVVWLWLIPQMTRKEDKGMARTAVKLEKEVTVVSKFPSPPQAEALELVKNALAVREVAKVSDYFRLGTATPQAVVEFLKNLEQVDGAYERSDWLSSIDANHLALDGVLVSSQQGDKSRKRLALLTPDAEGKWKLDFDALARTGTPAWADVWASKAPAVSLVRVYIAKDNYYNGPFSDEQRWECYCLASPDTDQILLGYCKKGTSQATALQRIFTREQPMLRATLEIRRAEDGESRQFEISRVLAEDWALGPVPFDEISR
jgi:hypothetical protein